MDQVKDVIYLDDCRASMLEGFRNGYQPGETTHFKDINGHYSLLRGDVTLFGGIGNHGKSTFYVQLAALRALNNKEKFAVFSPEMHPPDYFYNDVIHMITGTYPAKGATDEGEYVRQMNWVKERFFYIFPEDESPTPDYINSRFEQVIKVHGVDGVCVDPFNQLVNDWHTSGRDDRYISTFLQTAKRFAQKQNVYYHILVHPKGNISTDDAGDLKCPNVFNLAGGAMWSNHADNIIFIHRPHKLTDQHNMDSLISIAKIKKQKIVGIPDDIPLTFNRSTNRYSDKYGSPFTKDYGLTSPAKELFEVDKDPF